MGDPVTFALVGAGPASIALSHANTPAVPRDIASVYVDVMGVDGLHTRCAGKGLDITQPPTTHPWGQRDFVMRIPSGHQLAFGERVSSAATTTHA